MPAKEIWKPVAGYEGFYEVSSLGRVRSLGRTVKACDGTRRKLKGKVLAGSLPRAGRHGKIVSMYGGQNRPSYSSRYVSHLVWESFIGPRRSGWVIVRTNGDMRDDRVENLRETTQSWLTKNNFDTGKLKALQGSKSPCSKLTEAQVLRVRKIYPKVKSLAVVAKMFGINFTTVSLIVNRKRWTHI